MGDNLVFVPRNRIRTARRTDSEVGVSLRQRRRWFADEEGTTAAAASTTPTPADKQGDKDATAANQTDKQEELNRAFAERARLAKQARENELLKELGFDPEQGGNLDGLKALVKQARDHAEGQKSELQKLQDKVTALEAKNQALQKEADETNAARVTDRRNAKITELAVKAKAEVPADVVVWAEANAADLLKATVKDDGTVDEAAVNKLVEECRKQRKGWFGGGGPGSPSNRGGEVPEPGKKEMEQARRDQNVRLQRRF